MKLAISPVYGVAAAAVVAALLYVKFKGAGSLGKDLGGAAVDMVDGVVTGAVEGIGKTIGLPETNKSECQKRIEEFRAAPWYKQAYLSFGVSANCSASDYLTFVGTGRGPGEK